MKNFNFNNLVKNSKKINLKSHEKAQEDSSYATDLVLQRLKSEAAINEATQSHLVFESKLDICIRSVNKVIHTIRNIFIFVVSSWYVYKKIILEEGVLSKIIEHIIEIIKYALNSPNTHWSLLIICSTIVCLCFIKSKYK